MKRDDPRFGKGGRVLSVYLPLDVFLAVEELAKEVNDSRNGVIVDAIRALVLKREKKNGGN